MKFYFFGLLLSIAAFASFPGTIPPNKAIQSDAFGNLQGATTSSTELNYLVGLTGNVQAQLNAGGGGGGPFVRLSGDTMSGTLNAPLILLGAGGTPASSSDLLSLQKSQNSTLSTTIDNENSGSSAASQVRLTTNNGTLTISNDSIAGLAPSFMSSSNSNGLRLTSSVGPLSLAFAGIDRLKITTAGDVNIPALTSSRVVLTDTLSSLTVSSITPTELGYLAGLTGNVQSQLNAVTGGCTDCVLRAGDTMTGRLVVSLGGVSVTGTSQFSSPSSPAQFVELDGGSDGDIMIFRRNATTVGSISGAIGQKITFGADADHALALATAGTERLRITTTGEVLVSSTGSSGSTKASNAIQVDGGIWADKGVSSGSVGTAGSFVIRLDDGTRQWREGPSSTPGDTSWRVFNLIAGGSRIEVTTAGSTKISGQLELNGSTSGSVILKAPAIATGTIIFPTTAAGAGSVLTADGSGATSWQIASMSGNVVTPGDSDYTITSSDTFVRTGVALTSLRTYTLPACVSGNVGEHHVIKKSVSSGSNLSAALTGGDTLDGGVGLFTITSQDVLQVFCAASTKWENY